MSSFDPDALPPEIEQLLAAERPIERPPLALEDRVLSRLHGRIRGAGPSDGDGRVHTPSSDAGHDVPSAPNGGVRAWTGLARPISALSTALVIGGAVGAAAHGAATSPRVVYVDRVVVPPPSAVAPTPPPELSATPSARPAQLPLPRASTEVPNGPASVRLSPEQELAAERTLLDAARAAFSEGDGTRALEIVGQHEKRFPTGLLVEEREALAIRSLLLEKRVVEARARAERFEHQFPGSLALGVIHRALEEIQ
jgi:hypothetical protein